MVYANPPPAVIEVFHMCFILLEHTKGFLPAKPLLEILISQTVIKIEKPEPKKTPICLSLPGIISFPLLKTLFHTQMRMIRWLFPAFLSAHEFIQIVSVSKEIRIVILDYD